MKLIRARSVLAVDMMKDKLRSDYEASAEIIASWISATLQNSPDNIFVLMCIDEKVLPEPSLMGFIVAFAPPGVKFATVVQAWVHPKLELSLVDKAFYRVLVWADSMGRDELRAETQRNAETFIRRWNFQHFSSIMSFKIPENLDPMLIIPTHNEITGKETSSEHQATSHAVDSDGRAKESSEHNRIDDSGESRPTSTDSSSGDSSTNSSNAERSERSN